MKDPDDFRKFDENVRVLLKSADVEGEMPIDFALEKVLSLVVCGRADCDVCLIPCASIGA